VRPQVPTPQAATALTLTAFETFAKAHRYPRPKELPARLASLQQPQPAPDPTTVAICQSEAVRLATLLLNLVQIKNTEARELFALFEQHPDYSTFHSLPGAGDFLGPALLVKFGDTCTCAARKRGASVTGNAFPRQRVCKPLLARVL
jgi:hypothetical protein